VFGQVVILVMLKQFATFLFSIIQRSFCVMVFCCLRKFLEAMHTNEDVRYLGCVQFFVVFKEQFVKYESY
jgi:hypothetical protein